MCQSVLCRLLFASARLKTWACTGSLCLCACSYGVVAMFGLTDAEELRILEEVRNLEDKYYRRVQAPCEVLCHPTSQAWVPAFSWVDASILI